MPSNEEIARLVITLEGQVKDLKKQLGIGKKQVTKYENHVVTALKSIKIAWLAVAAGIYLAQKAVRNISTTFGQFSHKMHEVNTLLGLTVKGFRQLTEDTLKLIRKVPQTARELANALYDIISAGVALSDSNYVLEQSAKAAVAGVTSTKVAAKTALSIINAYDKSLNELGDTYDQLFKTVKLGVITFEQIGSTIGNILPNARAANVEISDILASLAVMTKGGFDAATASTAIRAGLIKLAAPAGESKEAMERLGIEWKGWIPTLKRISELGLDLKQMREIIPDERSAKAVISLTQNFQLLEKTLEEFTDRKGAMKDAFDIMRDSPINKIKMLSNAFDELKISLANALSPAALWSVERLTELLRMSILLTKGWSLETIKFMATLDRQLPEIKDINGAIQALYEKQLETTQKKFKLTEKIKDLEQKSTIWKGFNRKQIQDANKELKQLEIQSGLLYDAIQKLKVENILNVDVETDEEKTEIIAPKTDKYLSAIVLFKEQVTSELQELEQAYEDNRITINEYYRDRKQTATNLFEAEIGYLKESLLLAKDKNEQDKIKLAIQIREIEHKRELAKLTFEEAKANKEFIKSQYEIDKLLEEIEGRIALDKASQYEKDIANLISKQKQEEEIILDSIKSGHATEQDLIRAQNAWEIEQFKLKEKYKQQEREKTLSRLQNILQKGTNIAKTMYDMRAQVVANYEESIRKLRSIGKDDEADQLEEKNKVVKREAIKQFNIYKALALAEAGIAGALAIAKAWGQGGAYGAVLAILVAIQTGLQLGKIASMEPGFAEGGMVEGPAGKDKVKARLTRKEYVQSPPAVQYYGKGVMEAMNRRLIPKSLFGDRFQGLSIKTPSHRFQTGGSTEAIIPEQQKGMNLQIVNVVDKDLIAQYLQTNMGQTAILNVIRERNYEVKRVLEMG